MSGIGKKPSLLRELEKRLMFDASLPAITGQVLWLDADDTSTILDAEGDNADSGAFSGQVQTWVDKSTSGFSVTAAGSTNRPTYTTGALNGNNLLTFDGGSDFLRNTGASIAGDDYTIFAVFNRTTATGRDAVYELGSGTGSRNGLYLNDTGSGRVQLYHNTAFISPTVTYSTSSYILSAITLDASTYNLYQNGANVGTGTTASPRTTSTGIYIGADATPASPDELQGNIAEIIIYDRDLTADERHDVETYLAGKWGLSITNATPTVSTNTGTTLAEGATTMITSAMLGATDTDNTESTLIYTVNDVTDRGTLFLDADSDGVIDAGETLGLNSTFTQGDIASNLVKYTHNGLNFSNDAFGFTVTDQLATTASTTFNLSITLTGTETQMDAISNAVLHLDAHDIDNDGDTTDQPTNGSAVGTWTDSKGSVDNATQTNTANQPIYNANAFGTGIGGLVFDGSNDRMIQSVSTEINGNYAQKSYAMVFRSGSDISGNQVIFESGNQNGGVNFGIFNGNIYAYTFKGGTNKAIDLGPATANTTYQLTAVYDVGAGTWRASLNGGAFVSVGVTANLISDNSAGAVGSNNGSTRSPVDFTNISGNTAPFEGVLGEFWIWNGALTTSEITTVNDYFQDKWFTTITNAAPGITVIADQTINEDTPTSALTFTLSDAETALGSLIVTGSSSNTAIVDDANIVITGAGVNRTVTVTPIANAFGTVTISPNVNDGSGNITTETFDVIVNAVNDTPTLSAAGPFSFNENISAGTAVVTMAGADVDTADTLSYSIESGNTASMFAINSSTGAITFAGSPDFETLSTYNLVVRVTDNGMGSLFAERTVIVNINDLNDAPTIATNTGATMNEGATLVITNAMLNEGDPDDSGTGLTYTASGLVNGIVTVNNVTQNTFTQADIDAGIVRFVNNGGENTLAGFNISLADGGENGATPATGSFAITVTPVNDAPVIDGWTLIANEDFQSGATGWANNTTTTDPGIYLTRYLGPFSNDGGVQSNSKTYTLTGNQDYTVIQFDFYRLDSWETEAFRIFVNDTQILTQNFTTAATTIADGSSGITSWTVTELNTISGQLGNASGTFFNDQAFRFTMTIQNAGASTVKIGFGSTTNQAANDESWGIDNVKVYEVDDGGTPGAFSVAENTANGSVVGTITAGDIEGNAITYSITGGTGSSAFAINATTGVITVSNTTLLNYESVTSYTLIVRATDNGSPAAFDQETITINISDIPENTAPTVNALGPLSVAENAAVNTVVGTATGSDAEGNTITWSITAGNTDNIFAINATTGVITVGNIAGLDREWATTYTITIRGTDNGFGALSATRNVTVNISDVNEAPTFDSTTALLDSLSLSYNATTGNFYRFVNNTVNYTAATTAANAATLYGVGGYLATITSAAENTYVRGLAGTAQIWLGGSDTASEGVWRWVNGGTESGVQFWQGAAGGSVQNSLYANWGSGEPNNAGGGVGEDFMVMLAAGTWNDLVGTGSSAYMIEWNGASVLAAVAALQNGPYTIAENSVAGTSVGTLEASDPDSGDTITYSITGGTGSSLFNLNATTGAITVATGAVLNFEGTASFTLDVRAQDVGGLFGTRTVTINLSDVNETPTLAAAGPLNVNENVSSGTAVVTMAGADVDSEQTLSYSIQSGNTGSMFAINSSTGAITFAGSPNFEALSSYSLVVRVTDNGTGSLFAERTVVVNIDDVNETPTLAAAGPFSLNENVSSGTVLTTMAGADVDGGQTLTYSIQSGNTGSMFAINSSTGAITFAGSPNFENLSTYNLVVRVTDNGTGSLFAERTVTVNINDLNETPTLAAAGPFNVNENVSSGTAVTTMVGADVDAGQTLTYTIQSGNTGSMFAINSSTGAITFAGSPNFESVSSYNLVVRVTDNGTGSLFAERTVTVNINDLNETPTLTAAGPFSVFENTSIGATVATMASGDVDTGQSLTYTIESGNTGGAFSINAATGVITIASALDYETLDTYSLVIRVTDNGAGALFAERTVVVNIDDTNNAPTDILLSNNSVDENKALGWIVGSLSALDSEMSQTHTYSLVDNAGGRLSIAGNELRVSSLIDFEATPSMNITIRADDGFGGTFDKIFTINVADIFEPTESSSSSSNSNFLEPQTGITLPSILPQTSVSTQTILAQLLGGDAENQIILNGGNILGSSLSADQGSFDTAFYGDTMQILRTNMTMAMNNQPVPDNFVFDADYQDVDVPEDIESGAQSQEKTTTQETFSNIRAQLEALQRLEHGRDTKQAGEIIEAAHKNYGQFKDVLTYHEAKQAKLREALLNS